MFSTQQSQVARQTQILSGLSDFGKSVFQFKLLGLNFILAPFSWLLLKIISRPPAFLQKQEGGRAELYTEYYPNLRSGIITI